MPPLPATIPMSMGGGGRPISAGVAGMGAGKEGGYAKERNSTGRAARKGGLDVEALLASIDAVGTGEGRRRRGRPGF